MSVRVIIPPEPFVVPADIPGIAFTDELRAQSLIAASIEEMDGPSGWLGRCLGPQLLEWTPDRWPCEPDLPYGPWLETESVKYIDPAGAEQTWAFPTPLYFGDVPRARGRRGDIRIQYWAGYGKRNETDPDKWDVTVPERAKQAVIIAVQDLLRLGASGSLIRSETVEDIGQRSYVDADRASAITRSAADRLLQGLKVYRI